MSFEGGFKKKLQIFTKRFGGKKKGCTFAVRFDKNDPQGKA